MTLLLGLLLLSTLGGAPQEDSQDDDDKNRKLPKAAGYAVQSSDSALVHDVGLLSLALSPESTFGGFFLPQSPPQHAGQWPGALGHNYIAGGGLWVGHRADSAAWVMHRYYGSSFEGGDWKVLAGSLPKTSTDVSDQDHEFVYSDSAAPEPIGLVVTQTSRQWSQSGVDQFIVFEYEILNNSGERREDLYASFWLDPDLVLEASTFIYDDLASWDPTRQMVYLHDSGVACNDPALNPDNLLCPPGHVGALVLRHPIEGNPGPRPHTVAVWDGGSDPDRSILDTDEQFLDLMTGGVNVGDFDSTAVVPADYRVLLTARPFSLDPGESETAVFGLAIGATLSQLQDNADAMVEVFEATPLSTREGEQPAMVDLHLGSYPNPAAGRATIQFELPEPAHARMVAVDLLGREVAELTSGHRTAGSHEVEWEFESAAPGVYIVRLDTPTLTSAHKIVIAR